MTILILGFFLVIKASCAQWYGPPFWVALVGCGFMPIYCGETCVCGVRASCKGQFVFIGAIKPKDTIVNNAYDTEVQREYHTEE